MKEIIKIQLFLFVMVLHIQCRKENDPPVKIDDPSFLNALIRIGVDINGDSIISYYEADKITSLKVNSENISDMTGIEAFVNLDTLLCYNNQLNSLDLSGNSRL